MPFHDLLGAIWHADGVNRPSRDADRAVNDNHDFCNIWLGGKLREKPSGQIEF